MICHPQENKITKIIRFLAFWLSILIMIWLFILVFHDDVKVLQHEVTVKIDLKNKINICNPQDGEFAKESYLDF
jgi:branched-subunit amino acid transport protein AzlD